MTSYKKQQGITMWGMLAIAFLVTFFALIVIKLVPAYMTDMKVKAGLDSVARQAETKEMSNLDVLNALDKHFQVDNIDQEVKVREVVGFEKQGRARIVRLDYENVSPLFYNISILIEFEHSTEVGTFAE